MKKIILLINMLLSLIVFAQPNAESKNYTKLKLEFYNNDNAIKLVKDLNTKAIYSCDKNFRFLSYKLVNGKIIEDISNGIHGAAVVDNFYYKHHFLSYDKKKNVGLRLVVVNEDKKMKIDFNINKISPDNRAWFINMKIPFKEGYYQVTDPKNPTLIAIKENDLE